MTETGISVISFLFYCSLDIVSCYVFWLKSMYAYVHAATQEIEKSKTKLFKPKRVFYYL